MPDNTVKCVRAHLFNLDHSLHREIYATIDQIGHPNNPLCDIEGHTAARRSKSSRTHNYDSTHNLMTVYVSSTVNAEGATCVTAIHNVDDMKMLKEDY